MSQHRSTADYLPPVSLGVASIALGGISGVLFLLPVLGLPIGVAGLALGVVALTGACRSTNKRIAGSIAGCVVAAAAIGANLTSNVMPGAVFAPRTLEPARQAPTPRIAVPPPGPAPTGPQGP